MFVTFCTGSAEACVACVADLERLTFHPNNLTDIIHTCTHSVSACVSMYNARGSDLHTEEGSDKKMRGMRDGVDEGKGQQTVLFDLYQFEQVLRPSLGSESKSIQLNKPVHPQDICIHKKNSLNLLCPL